MIVDFCNNILIEILGYLNDKDSKNFSKSCKIINKVGYLKNLIMTNETDPFQFASDFYKHNLTLNTVISYKNISNPQYFMPSKWPKSVSIFYSKITDIISPDSERTEHLKLYLLQTTERPIKIDWKKFRNLKSVYIYCDDVVLDGIEICTKLTNIFINLNNKKTLNRILGSFKNLKYLITNCNIQQNTVFLSQELEIFISKNMDDETFKFNSRYNLIKDRNNFPYYEETIYNNLKILKY